MNVHYQTRSVFFHNPKTGGRSVAKVLGLEDDKHLKLIHFEPEEARKFIFQESWGDYFKFSFVRNPWDRLVSLYEFQRSVDYGLFQNQNFSHNLARSYEFDDWVQYNYFHHKRQIRRSNWFGIPQSTWTVSVDEVYKFENFSDALAAICKRLGVTPSFPHENRSRRINEDYRHYYKRDETIESVADIDRETIQRFAYCF